MSQPIDPQVAAQLREVNPDREEVVTWTRFRVGCFRQKDPVTAEEIGRVLEFRSMDGREVHQFVLDQDVRSDIVEWLSAPSSEPKLVLPT